MNKYDGENVEVVITMRERRRERPEMKRDSGTHCDRSGETRKGGRHMFTHERPSDGDGGHFDHLERKCRVSMRLGWPT